MAEIDSLEIKISAEMTKASASITLLNKKLNTLSSSLLYIGKSLNKVSDFSKAMNGLNGNMFKGFVESAKTAETSMNKLEKKANKGIKAKATFDISDYKKVTKELSEKFGNLNIGKDIKASGNIGEMQKQYQSLEKELERLADKEQRIMNIGKSSPEGTTFIGVQHDIAKTLNQMATLEKAMKKNSQPMGGKTFTKKNPGFKINRWQEQAKSLQWFQDRIKIFTEDMKKTTSVINDFSILDKPIKNIEQDLEELKKLFPQEKTLIDSFVKEADRLKRLRTNMPEIKKIIPESAKYSKKETIESANKAVYGNKETGKTKNKMDKASKSVQSLWDKIKKAISSTNPSIDSVKNNISSLVSKMKKLGSLSLSAIPGIKSLGKAIKNSKNSVSGLAKQFLSLYAVMKLGKKAWESVTSAQDYIENFNYFSVALGKIGEDSKNQFKKAGYDSAEEYAESFKGRFNNLQKQMTGYDVNTETGDLNYNISHNLGLDISEIMQYQAQIAQVTNSTGQLGEVSINASKGLSMLAADWSSLSNTRLADVQNNLTSALNGQARAVYKYGIDLTQAGLQQIAYNHGISESVKNMSNASKQQLRLLGLIEGSKVAWGDLARTINQPANQLRMLQAGFKNLARSIGNLFLPIVQKVYPYLNAMVMVLQEFVQWIAKLTGIKLGDVSGVSLPDYSDAADGMDDYADSTDKASKKQKKLNDNLQGFDIINKLQDSKDASDSDKDKDKNKNIDLSGDIASALANYEKAWNKAFESAENKAVQIAEKMKKALLSGWEKGDFTELGKKLAAWVNKGLSNIPWDKIKKTVNKIAKSVATFLNGFIKDLDWKLVGKTFAEGLNTVIEGAYTFWTTFDWLKFGTSLAEGVNSFIQNFDAEKFGELLGAQLRGMIQFAFGFITNFDFTSLGTKIADSINGFFKDMGKVRQNTGLTGWQEMGQTISKSITGILDTINTALEGVKWEEVGKAIVEFLTSIDWWGILGKLVETIGTALKSALTLAISAIKEDPAGMIKALTGAFALIFTVKKLASGLSFLKETFKSLIGGGITNGISQIPSSGIISAIKSKIGSLGSLTFSIEFLVGSVSFAKSAWDNVFEKYDTTEIYNAAKEMGKSGNILAEAATGWGAILSGDFSFEEWGNGLKEWWEDQWSPDTAVKNIDSSVKEVEKHISEFGKHYNPVTGKTKVNSEERKRKKEEYLRNLKKENPQLYKSYIDYEEREEELNKTTEKLSETFKLFGNDAKTAGSRINSLKNEVRNGNISLSAYKKLVNGTYKSNKEWTEALRDARIATKYFGGDTEKFNEKGDKLVKTLKNLGVETGNAKNATSLLKDKLSEGEISLSAYEKICDTSYKTTDEFYDSLKNVKGVGDITSNIKATVEGKNDVDDLGNKITTIKDKNVKITANAETAEAKYKINNLATGKTVTIKASLGNTKEFKEKVANALKTTPFKMTAAQIFPSKEQITEYFKGITNSKAWKNAMKHTPTPGRKIIVNEKNKSVKIPKEADFGGVLSAPYAAMNYKIQYYQKGGFPEDGWFRANHGEIMGKFDNGQSVVANNEQITDGIAQAVGPAVYAAVKSAMNEQGGGSEKVLVVDKGYREITTGIIEEINGMTRSRGRSPLIGT